MPGYQLTIPAQNDIEKIWEYTADIWSIFQADKYIDGLLLTFDRIADRKVEGKSIESIRKGYRKVLFHKHYIFFRVLSDADIEIIRVLHVSMDVENRLS